MPIGPVPVRQRKQQLVKRRRRPDTVTGVTDSTFEIRLMESADDMASIVTVFQQVWGTTTPIVNVELLRAIGHAGGYVSAVFEEGRVVGASFGFLARHHGESALHSHVTGVLAGLQHSGVGRAVKIHQREWAAERDIPWITWTFDPLVRRNAWFNIEVLEAQVAQYVVDFYGPMTDSVNGNDESDRLIVAWPTDPSVGRPVAPDGPGVEVATPEDIVVLRRTDPHAARTWRERVRRELGDRLAAGGVVTGFTRDGAYVVHEQA